MSIIPPFLKKGDVIAIISTAKKNPSPLDHAIQVFKSWGLEVMQGKSTEATFHTFAGDDDLRAQDLQKMLDDDKVKAIISSRGGYGTVRMIDKVDFSNFAKNPKWLVGFSDLTVLLSHVLARCDVQSIHGPMPCTFKISTEESIQTLRKALFGETIKYECKGFPLNRKGETEGALIGGNLCLMVNILNSETDVDYEGKILLLEDVHEQYYAIDRYLYTLKRAGKLKKLAGLMIGEFANMKDGEVPFGITIPEMVMNLVKDYDYPVCFDFPFGHGANNHALIIGKKLHLSVGEEKTTAYYVNETGDKAGKIEEFSRL